MTYSDSLKQLIDNQIAHLKVHYIGKEQQDGGLRCKHSKSECIGNIQQLCVQDLVSNEGENTQSLSSKALAVNGSPDAMKLIDFIDCQSENLDSIPDSGEKCANQVGLDLGEINKCVNSDYGLELLSESFQSSREFGVSVSCTVFIDQKQFCQHDTEWKNCPQGHTADALTKAVCKQFLAKNTDSSVPKICRQ